MSGETVRVVVRCRPANDRERSLKCKTVVHMDPSRATCSVTNPSDPSAPKQFTFDSVYFTDSTAEQVYNDVVFPLVENNLEGYNGTVFAYGQTGSGKTFTMQGVNEPPAQRGIIPRAFQHVFEAISTTENVKFLVHSSFIEIYNEEVRDLLGSSATSKLDIKEHPEKGVYVAGLSMHAVHNVAECETLMQRGWNQRHTAATLMNAQSSRAFYGVRDCPRSHSIFTVHMEMMSPDRKGDQHIRTAKLHLVDLAGSERQSKTDITAAFRRQRGLHGMHSPAVGCAVPRQSTASQDRRRYMG